MNLDTMLIKKLLGLLNPFEAVTLTCNCSPERSADPLDKAIEHIKASQEENREKVVQSVQKEAQKQIDQVEKKLKMETNAIKHLVKREIEAEKEALSAHMTTVKKEMVNSRKSLLGQVQTT